MGDIELKRERLDDALVFLQKSAKLKSDIRLAQLDLGEVFARRKQYIDAVSAYRKAIALAPAEPDAHYRLAQVYKAVGKTAESQRELAKVRELRQKADDAAARAIKHDQN